MMGVRKDHGHFVWTVSRKVALVPFLARFARERNAMVCGCSKSSPFRGLLPAQVATASENAVRGAIALQPDDFRTVGPLRLLRRHLPPRGEDCENGDVLPLQGEVAAKRSEGAPMGLLACESRPASTGSARSATPGSERRSALSRPGDRNLPRRLHPLRGRRLAPGPGPPRGGGSGCQVRTRWW